MCECRAALAKGPPLQVEVEELYGEVREWLAGPSRSWRLLRRPGELKT